MQFLNNILSAGGDERVVLDKEELNFYHLSPISKTPIINRGTCTSSTASKKQQLIIEEYYNQYQKIGHSAFKNEIVNELYEVLDLNINYDMFLASSGTDLCYYPLLFSKIISKNKSILNITTNFDELGRGMFKAYKGDLYFKKNLLSEYFEDKPLVDLSNDVEAHFLKTRDCDGKVASNFNEIKALIDQSKDQTILLNLNICSKSGVCDDLSIIDEVQKNNDVIVTIDCCQFRNKRKVIKELLDKDCCVMITGSKFFGSPPFCAAFLVPESLSKKIKTNSENYIVPEFFKRIFTADNFPNEYVDLKNQFLNIENNGLLLRWKIALQQMKSFFKYESNSDDIIVKWNEGIFSFIRENDEHFEIMPECVRNFKSIVSFKVKKDGSYLGYEALQKLRVRLLDNLSEFQNQQMNILIGQPVKYEQGAFIRVALGASEIVDAQKNGFDISKDLFVLKQIIKEIK